MARIPSPIFLMTCPRCAATARSTASSCSSRMRRHASSPIAASCSVDATMSVNSTVAKGRSSMTSVSLLVEEPLDLREDGRGVAEEDVGLAARKLDEAGTGNAARRRPTRLDVPAAVLASMQHERGRPHGGQRPTPRRSAPPTRFVRAVASGLLSRRRARPHHCRRTGSCATPRVVDLQTLRRRPRERQLLSLLSRQATNSGNDDRRWATISDRTRCGYVAANTHASRR